MTQARHIHILNRIFLCLHLIFSVMLGIYRITHEQWYFSFLAFSSFLLLLLPNLFFKLINQKPVPQLNTLIYIYCTLSFTIGMALQAYHSTPFYDKLIHTLSGTFFAFLGLICYSLLKAEKRIDYCEVPVATVFSFSFSMMLAVVWEIYEYFISLVSVLDPQNTLMTGIHDTMQDISVCLLGTILFIIPEYLYFKKGIKDLFMASYEAFINSEE